jgi:hypothetical protein
MHLPRFWKGNDKSCESGRLSERIGSDLDFIIVPWTTRLCLLRHISLQNNKSKKQKKIWMPRKKIWLHCVPIAGDEKEMEVQSHLTGPASEVRTQF